MPRPASEPTDGAGIRRRPRQPIELRHHQGATGVHCRWRLIESEPGAGGVREPVIEVHAIVGDAEFDQAPALGGQVLFVGGAADVAGDRCAHGVRAYVQPRQPEFSSYEATAAPQVQAMLR